MVCRIYTAREHNVNKENPITLVSAWWLLISNYKNKWGKKGSKKEEQCSKRCRRFGHKHQHVLEDMRTCELRQNMRLFSIALKGTVCIIERYKCTLLWFKIKHNMQHIVFNYHHAHVTMYIKLYFSKMGIYSDELLHYDHPQLEHAGQPNGCTGAVHGSVYMRPEDQFSVSTVFGVRMGIAADISEFHKGQTVMTRHLGTSITETVRLVGCSCVAVVSTIKSGAWRA